MFIYVYIFGDSQLAKKHNFEIKAFKVTCPLEQLRAPRLVRIGLIQNMIAKPTTAPVKEQVFVRLLFFFFFCVL